MKKKILSILITNKYTEKVFPPGSSSSRARNRRRADSCSHSISRSMSSNKSISRSSSSNNSNISSSSRRRSNRNFISSANWNNKFEDIEKLDGVGPVDNRPSPNKLHHFVKKKKNVTCDLWHVTYDIWHMTRDMLLVTRLGRWTFSQNFTSLALTICDLWYYEDDLMNQSMTRFIEQPRLHRVC